MIVPSKSPMTSSRAPSAIGFVALAIVGAVLLIGVVVEGGTILLNLRAADDGLRAAAEAAGLAVEIREENGYAVRALRELDSADGPSALTAAQVQIQARGLADRVQVDSLTMLDDVVVLSATCRVPAALGRVLGLTSYDFTLTALGDAGP